MEKLNYLIIYFVVYSLFGWILESTYKTILQKRFVNSGFLNGPFCPIYGFGALIMLLFLRYFENKPIQLFFVSFIILSIWEYIVGFILEKIFKTKYWDYSKNKFNIKGRVCLLNSIFWGALGLIFINFIHPFIEEKINLLNYNILLYINIALLIYMITDMIISAIKVNNINIKLKTLEEITDNIKAKLDEIISIKLKPDGKIEAIQNKIEELKQRETELKQNIEKKLSRIKKAFPTMKSERMAKLLNTTAQLKKKIKKS